MGVREHEEEMRPVMGVGARRGLRMLDPAIEKYLLDLHAAMDLESFWMSTQQLLCATIPNQVLGLSLRHDPILPLVERWTVPMPPGFFGSRRLKQVITARPRKKLLRVVDLFSDRRAFARSMIYRRYIASQNCRDAACLWFWEGRRLICAIVIIRTASQGDFSTPQMNLLRQFHSRFAIALQRLRMLERERSIRTDLEEFVRRLPLPTILLRWNLKLLFQNRAARDFCAMWQNGELARLIKSSVSIPTEIMEGCRRLKQRWRAKTKRLSGVNFMSEQVRHSTASHLRVTIRLKQLNDAVAHPHFVIECEDLRRLQERDRPELDSRLSQLVRLTGREQEIARLVCNGQSNQEVADAARLSLPTVKKHLHTVFRKLEVTSRAQLMRLML
jgi:DNA-binding CsgD family transcriptional regulator